MIELSSHGYRLRLDPRHGATVTAAEWRDPDGKWLALLEPLPDPAAGLKAGCFVMAPFANRIDGGRFEFEDRRFTLPINRPSDGMAIHGFARDRSWQVKAKGDASATLTLDFAEAGIPWAFALRQQVTLGAHGIHIGLQITNQGETTMPFGLGLHPWFPKRPGTHLTFSAAGIHTRDARGLPLPDIAPVPALTAADARPLDGLPWLDGSFSGWTPRTALVRWPGQGAELALFAEGALRHLHVYIPDDRAVFCAEPVSHLPDAVNRPDLGPEAQMTPLAPGESLSGALRLIARATPVQPEVSP